MTLVVGVVYKKSAYSFTKAWKHVRCRNACHSRYSSCAGYRTKHCGSRIQTLSWWHCLQGKFISYDFLFYFSNEELNKQHLHRQTVSTTVNNVSQINDLSTRNASQDNILSILRTSSKLELRVDVESTSTLHEIIIERTPQQQFGIHLQALSGICTVAYLVEDAAAKIGQQLQAGDELIKVVKFLICCKRIVC